MGIFDDLFAIKNELVGIAKEVVEPIKGVKEEAISVATDLKNEAQQAADEISGKAKTEKLDEQDTKIKVQ